MVLVDLDFTITEALRFFTYREITLVIFSLEQLTPVHELARGRHGSPDQSTGGSLMLSKRSSIAVTAQECFS